MNLVLQVEACYMKVRVPPLTLSQSGRKQDGALGRLLGVRLDEQPRFDLRRRRVRPPTQSAERRVDLQLLLQAGADALVLAQQTL